jgi:2-keto-4-pentenoate hydratase/2-oxohepta-3-ene-1,7-dioic acid hydratase in catechol pathway
MKLVTYKTTGEARLGAVRDGGVIDLAKASDGELPSDMMAFLERGEKAMRRAQQIVAEADPDAAQSSVTLLAPVPFPSKIVAIGQNYMDHIRESDSEPPDRPVMFCKFSTAVIGHGAEICWDPALTSQVDYEVELAVVLGRCTRRVSEEEALDYVAGYTVCNDVSARDLQFGDGQWVRAKSLDTFCPLGPVLVTADEIPDPQDLDLRSVLNGNVMQDSNTKEMIFGVRELIAVASRAFTLLPGDVIVTGTPHGVGAFREPPIFLHDGDQITVQVDGIGQLTNFCVEEEL